MAVLWKRLGFEQKVAAVASALLIVSTVGPFSGVEAGIVLTAGGVLALLRARALGRHFHLPSGDGTVILLAAGWAALLILARIGDRPFGQTVLSWACAALLGAAGLRERDRRPADDVSRAPARPTGAPSPADEQTVLVPRSEDVTEPLRDERPPRPDGPPRPR